MSDRKECGKMADRKQKECSSSKEGMTWPRKKTMQVGKEYHSVREEDQRKELRVVGPICASISPTIKMDGGDTLCNVLAQLQLQLVLLMTCGYMVVCSTCGRWFFFLLAVEKKQLLHVKICRMMQNGHPSVRCKQFITWEQQGRTSQGFIFSYNWMG